jgi:hypothetical protein
LTATNAAGSVTATATVTVNVGSGLSFTYTLASDVHTSAGVFDSSGTLIRTLWSNLAQSAGNYTKVWDGKDDYGSAASTSATYTVKVLSSNVTYTWDGVIGNSEATWTGSANIWDVLGYTPNQLRLAFIGSNAWVASGYSEGSFNLYYFNTSTPNTPTIANPGYQSQNIMFQDIDTDGTSIYMPNGQVLTGQNFITKFTVSGNTATPSTSWGTQKYPFSSGDRGWNGISLYGIEFSNSSAPTASTIAVQNSALSPSPTQILAVGYVTTTGDTIKFFNASTGAEYGTPISASTLASPNSMGFTTAGLWVQSASKVYLINPSGQNVAPLSTPLDNCTPSPRCKLSNPVFVATNKANNHIFVLDGGTSQQVKEFDSTYALVRTYGDLGGYNDFNPTITNTRLMLDDTAITGLGTTNGSWLKVSPSNELWFCDCGNSGRILHISANNTYVNQILFGMERYAVGISETDPTRIFEYGIEYAIDYSKNLQPGDPDPNLGGNGAWKMVRNWNVGVGGANGSSLVGKYSIRSVATLSNGRTYGYAQFSGSDSHQSGIIHEIELPNSGTQPMRLTGIQDTSTCSTSNTAPPGRCFDYNSYTMQTDGSIIQMLNSSGVLTLNQSKLDTAKYPPLGFDSNGDPQRTAYQNIVTVNYDSTKETSPSQSGWGMTISYEPTTAGVYAMYDTGIGGGALLTTITSGSTTATVRTNNVGGPGIVNGMTIFGSGIPEYTTVTNWNSSTGTLTLSNAATSTTTLTTYTGTIAKGSKTVLTVGGTTDISTGTAITGTGIPANTTVSAWDSSTRTLTLSSPATADGTFSFVVGGTSLQVVPTGVAHLSGATPGRNTYLFSTNRENLAQNCVPDNQGTWPSICFNKNQIAITPYGGHEGINSQTLGNNIFTAYDGQYAPYGNQFYHYWTDGLMVGQYGGMVANSPNWFMDPNSNPAWTRGGARLTTAAGNIGQVRYVFHNGDAYMYMTTEAGLTPLQRWHITNLNSIVEITGNGKIGTTLNVH